MDSDDISVPERFKLQVEFLDNHPEYSVCGGTIEIFGAYHDVWHYPSEPKYFDFIKGCLIAHPAVMLRREDFNKFNLRYKTNILCEDYELWSRAVRIVNFYNLSNTLLYYRVHDKNAHLNPKLAEADTIVRNNMINFLTNNDKYKQVICNLLFLREYTFLEKIFSLKNTNKIKVLCILGLKFPIRRTNDTK